VGSVGAEREQVAGALIRRGSIALGRAASDTWWPTTTGRQKQGGSGLEQADAQRHHPDGQQERGQDFPAAQISDYLPEPGTVVWLDLCEPDPAHLEVLSEEFGLHPLAVEDAMHDEHHRPKLDRYQTHSFLTAYAVRLDGDRRTVVTGGWRMELAVAMLRAPRVIRSVVDGVGQARRCEHKVET
jgi:hypothetical protein